MVDVVWLNGTFGCGKSTKAMEFVAAQTEWRLFDTEHVGFMLEAQFPDRPVDDIQHRPLWRRLVPIVASELAHATGQNLLIVQTVLQHEYWEELAEGIRAQGHSLHHVLIDVDAAALERRITDDHVLHGAAEWRLQHIPAFLAARTRWLVDAADLRIDTTSVPPAQATERLAEAIAHWTTPSSPSRTSSTRKIQEGGSSS
ncbi:AAA family ATPase [Nocardia vaccinii]|uniref:AAA family ATPase n=1 Tax=Nocardia vaccinii TaxID=1822 RepID=UPI000AAEE3FF|nr:AAA family ATPase [Nocardia vaccinii]